MLFKETLKLRKRHFTLTKILNLAILKNNQIKKDRVI